MTVMSVRMSLFNICYHLIEFIKKIILSDDFFKTIHADGVSIRKITQGAFSKTLKELHHQAFTELDRWLVTFFYKYFPSKKWKGFHVFAISGSVLTEHRYWAKAHDLILFTGDIPPPGFLR
jgi:hypothetical protein